jgi:hypothetical protein
VVHSLPPWRRRALLAGCAGWVLCHAALTPICWWARDQSLDPGWLFLELACAWLVAGLVTVPPRAIDMGPLVRGLAVTGCFALMDRVSAGRWGAWWLVLPLWACVLLSAFGRSRRAFLASSLVLFGGTLSVASAPLLGGGWHHPEMLGPRLAEQAVHDARLVAAACAVVLVAAIACLAQRRQSSAERLLAVGIALGALGLAVAEAHVYLAAEPLVALLHDRGAPVPDLHLRRWSEALGALRSWSAAAGTTVLTLGWLAAHGGGRSRGARNAWAWVAAPALVVLCVAILRAPARFAHVPQPPDPSVRLPGPSWPDGRPPMLVNPRLGRVVQVVLERSGEVFVVTDDGLESLLFVSDDRLDLKRSDTVLAYLDAGASVADAHRLLTLLESEADVRVAVAGGPEPDRDRSHERWSSGWGSSRKQTARRTSAFSFSRVLHPFGTWSVSFGFGDGRCAMPPSRSCSPPFTVEGALEAAALEGCDALVVWPPPDVDRWRIPRWSVASEPEPPPLSATLSVPKTPLAMTPPPPWRLPWSLLLGVLLGCALMGLWTAGALTRGRAPWLRPRDRRAARRHHIASYRDRSHQRHAPLTRSALLEALARRATLAAARALPLAIVLLATLVGLLLGGALSR